MHQLTNANIVKGNEIAMEIEHVRDTHTLTYLKEDNVVMLDSLSST